MRNNEVQLWIALDKNKNYIFIENAIQGEDYYCPSCGGIVRARAINSNLVTEHFYHINRCNCNGGESSLHLYWKNNLINIGEEIYLPTIGNITCIDKRIEFTFNTKDGIYRPDLIIKTDNPNNRFIIFEIYNTNKKNISEYEDIWNELKYPVFEIDVKNLRKNKDNLNEELTLLYDRNKEYFIKNSKMIIGQLYNKLTERIENKNIEIPRDIQKMIDLGFVSEIEIINKIKSYPYKRKYPFDEGILNQYSYIFENNLNVKMSIDNLKMMLTKQWWSKNTYKDIVIPLLNIHNELEIYVQ